MGSQEWGQKRAEQTALFRPSGKVMSSGRAGVHAFELQGFAEVLRGCLICAEGAPEHFLGVTANNKVY